MTDIIEYRKRMEKRRKNAKNETFRSVRNISVGKRLYILYVIVGLIVLVATGGTIWIVFF